MLTGICVILINFSASVRCSATAVSAACISIKSSNIRRMARPKSLFLEESFIGQESVFLILGKDIFHCLHFTEKLLRAAN